MVKNNSSNQDFTNNADGFDLSGGTAKRKLTVKNGDVELAGGGANTLTLTDNASIEGTNTGDEDATSIGTLINGATAKTTPVDADMIGLMDSAATNILKKVSWANIKATLKSYFDDIYNKVLEATGTEVNTGTEQNKYVSPKALADSDYAKTTDIPSMASSAEINTGTNTTKTINPDALAGANIGIRYVEMTLFDYATELATGDGKGYFTVPTGLNGMNLVYVHAEVISAGTTGTTDIQIYNVTDSVDMLSTKLTIDSGETGSDTAATPAVIDTTKDDIASYDLLRIDVDAVSTTKPKGLIVTMGFKLP